MTATQILFPSLSQENPGAEGVLTTWFVADGEQVERGQLIGEAMVEKVSGDVHAPVAGRVRLLVEEDKAVRQGEVIAQIE